MPKPETPTCDKLSACSTERGTIVDFLEWLQDQGMEIASYHKHTEACRDEDGMYQCGCSSERLYSVNKHHDALAFQFLDIDPKKLEEERQLLLASLHA